MSKGFRLKYFLANLSLTKKMLMLTILIGSLVWVSMDHFVKITVEKAFLAQTLLILEDKAREGRYRFRRHIYAYYQAAQLFTLQKNFADYVKKQSWNAQEVTQVKYHKRSPKWFVKQSLLRNFISPRFVFLLDPRGKVREVYKTTLQLPPQSLLKPSVRMLQLVSDEVYIMRIEGVPYLVTAKSLLDKDDEIQATLVLTSPLDTNFLLTSQGAAKGESIMALVNDESHKVFASSDLFQVSTGQLIEELNQDFVVIKQQSLDYGNSEVNFRFISLVPKTLLDPQIKAVVNQARLRQTLQALIFIFVFALITLWITKRIGNLTEKVVKLSHQCTLGSNQDQNGEHKRIFHAIHEEKKVNDEIGSLISGFNNMLMTINQRDQEVLSLNEQLNIRAAELSDSLEQLKKTQKQMLESEKMASLGSLVAGVAHEINTPIGVSLTAASFLENRTKKFIQSFEEEEITKADFVEHFEESTELLEMVIKNLENAAKLISSFKLIAVDQSSQFWGSIDFKNYLDEVLLSLHPKYKHLMDQIDVDCAEHFLVWTNPGSIAQIVTNLVVNSVEHAFVTMSENDRPRIKIQLSLASDESKKTIHMEYHDNGCGMNDEKRKRIFEPFYTTRRQRLLISKFFS